MLLQVNFGLLWSNGCNLLSRCCFWHCICLFLSLFLCSQLLLQVCPRLGFSLRNENPCCSARDVFGASTTICNNHNSHRQGSFPERRPATSTSNASAAGATWTRRGGRGPKPSHAMGRSAALVGCYNALRNISCSVASLARGKSMTGWLTAPPDLIVRDEPHSGTCQ